MATTGELKFKLALEDEGINWDISERVLDQVDLHLTTGFHEEIGKMEDDLNEIHSLASRPREVSDILDEGLLADLEALAKPLPDGKEETVEELREALAEIVEMYSLDVQHVRETMIDIEGLTGKE